MKVLKLFSAALPLFLFGISAIKAQDFSLNAVNASDIRMPGTVPAVPLPAGASGQPYAYDFWGRTFQGSPDPKVAASGMLPITNGSIALLDGGEESLAARLQTLKNAKRSIRIQALIFTADETGTAVARILKEKHKQGLDVRVIVDAFSNIMTSSAAGPLPS